MTTLAFCIGALFAVLGAIQVLSHKERMPLILRVISFGLGVVPGAVGARCALARMLPESFFFDAIGLLCLIVATRLTAREHRREAVSPSPQASSMKGLKP